MSTPEAYIFEISKSSFEKYVIQNSHKIPVLVEFMGVWSEPCFQMADVLSKLAKEFAGQFIFAKVDIDEQPELRDEYSVENVPTLKVIKGGEVVRTEEGLMQEEELRGLLKTFDVFRFSDELRMQAREKHMAGETIEAITLLTQAIQQDPSNTRVAMDMVQVMLDIDELEQAKAIFNKLPDPEKESETGRALIGQLTFKDLASKTQGKDELHARISSNPDDFDAYFDLAICYVADRQFNNAMDALFTIFEKNPEYKDGAAREMIISLVNMLAPNDPQLASEFRRRLGSEISK